MVIIVCSSLQRSNEHADACLFATSPELASSQSLSSSKLLEGDISISTSNLYSENEEVLSSHVPAQQDLSYVSKNVSPLQLLDLSSSAAADSSVYSSQNLSSSTMLASMAAAERVSSGDGDPLAQSLSRARKLLMALPLPAAQGQLKDTVLQSKQTMLASIERFSNVVVEPGVSTSALQDPSPSRSIGNDLLLSDLTVGSRGE